MGKKQLISKSLTTISNMGAWLLIIVIILIMSIVRPDTFLTDRKSVV